ncbi:hypothetical protein [Aureimonas jatrophae]|uniref:Uncharacterized protein n=1 Tax=Aureimonas jatrophae TaxID=1166073 RepID=A0A1H0JEF1_9HYPH|nr:hypothetical protein [Aureimonas jatrophae]MBB3951448.1 hypothetical protein [Aureimonas jatrophae]SDO42128.1 hypothetical protein SAMN05192530_106147 [Aureimonas jatrophae]
MGSHVMLNVRNQHAVEREKILAAGIKEVVAELRLVEVVDYVAFLRLDLLGNIADIVDSSAQLFLRPGTLRFADGGDVQLGWGSVPRIDLDMEFRSEGVTVHFRLELSATMAAVQINYIAFAEPDADPAINTERLASAVEAARIPRSLKA